MNRMMKMKGLVAVVMAAAGLALTMGCAELQSEFDSLNQEMSKPADSGGEASTQSSASGSEKSGETASSSSSTASSESSASSGASTESSSASRSTDSEEAAVSQEPSAETRVHVTLDGQKAKPDANGIYWVVEKPVSATPMAEFTLDEAIGEMNLCILNIYLEKDGSTSGSPWAVTDYNVTPRLMSPGRAFNMANPGEGVTIIAPDGSMPKSCTFESGQRYIAVFSVTGSQDSGSVHVLFTVK